MGGPWVVVTWRGGRAVMPEVMGWHWAKIIGGKVAPLRPDQPPLKPPPGQRPQVES